MRFNKIIFFLLIITAFCNSKKERTEYYKDGSIKRIFELQDGKLNGKVFTYFPNGAPESISNWKEDKQEGMEEVFYPNGKLRIRAYWKNNKMNGPYEEYYENGNIFWRTTKKDNLPIGKSLIYDENGKLAEVEINNKEGETIYALGYKDGEIVMSSPIPIIKDYPDTARIGELIHTKIYFGYRLKGTVKAFVGSVNKGNELKDTIATIYPDKQGAFNYSFVAQKAGLNSIHFKFIHLHEPDDTIAIHDVVTKHSYFVKN